ncbi:MAG: hypothetical protein M3Z35_15375, partial [Nitrospirota bacterium]|nr:hypothetical protein [Nitrospirota bacterium]
RMDADRRGHDQMSPSVIVDEQDMQFLLIKHVSSQKKHQWGFIPGGDEHRSQSTNIRTDRHESY